MSNKDTKSAADKKAADLKQEKAVKTAEKRVKVIALNHLSGKYLLPYSPGQKFTIGEKQGQELIDNKDAKKIVAKKK